MAMLLHAQFDLGFMYQKGFGVEQDFAKAVEYFKLSADQGTAVAQNRLGIMYQAGQGEEQDFAKAAEYYRLATEQGFVSAYYNLGMMYVTGDGVEQDFSKAAEYLKPVADQGDADAQKFLGIMYEHGRGVEQDFGKAVEYYKLAADQGDEEAQAAVNRLNGEAASVEPQFSANKLSLDEIFVAEKEFGLIHDAVIHYNKEALEGGDHEICRIVTYKMAKTLAMRLEYPAQADKAFDLAYEQAKWLAENAVALSPEDRTSLVEFYLDRQTFNLGTNVKELVKSDPRYEATFGKWEAIEKFVSENMTSSDSSI